ncbi:protein kinase [Thiotrichales bacterium 19S3-7]|nr:protein kinase [Thiotrichales bacterium 19S3-7]MCF6800769.1 protein kinase [Thiotrichales bacterium 19S3-11]
MTLPEPLMKTDIDKGKNYQQQRLQAEAQLLNQPEIVKIQHQRPTKKFVSPRQRDKEDADSRSFISVTFDNEVNPSILGIDDDYLAKGGFGSVKLAIDKENRLFVIKSIKVLESDKETQVKQIQGEIDNLKKYTSKHDTRVALVKRKVAKKTFNQSKKIMEDYYEKYYIISEYEGPNLKSYIEKHKSNFSKDDQFDLAIMVFSVINELHQLGIAHRDLKPENITVKLVNGKIELRIIDFGLSETLAKRSSTPRGTPLYIPINVYNEENQSLDLYAGVRILGFLETCFNLENLLDPLKLAISGFEGKSPRTELEKKGTQSIFRNSTISKSDSLKTLLGYAMEQDANFPKHITAKAIMVLLILEKNDLTALKYLHWIITNPELQDKIITDHYTNPYLISSNYINELIFDTTIKEKLKKALNDEAFNFVISNASLRENLLQNYLDNPIQFNEESINLLVLNEAKNMLIHALDTYLNLTKDQNKKKRLAEFKATVTNKDLLENTYIEVIDGVESLLNTSKPFKRFTPKSNRTEKAMIRTNLNDAKLLLNHSSNSQEKSKESRKEKASKSSPALHFFAKPPGTPKAPISNLDV